MGRLRTTTSIGAIGIVECLYGGKFLKKERIQVTDHNLQRPPSNNDRVVEVYIGNYRRTWDWERFVQEPAAPEYAGKDVLDWAVVLDKLLNLRATKLLYSVGSENDKLMRGISTSGVHGILGGRKPCLKKTLVVNTTTVSLGNAGTVFFGHIEEGMFFSTNHLLIYSNPGT
jgi:hypothetical protein